MELKKFLRSMAIAGAGAALAYGTENIPSVDLGAYTPIVVAAYSVLANVVRKWLEKWAAARAASQQ